MLPKGFSKFYSQTGCSFDRNFANFRLNIDILTDSLSRASCNPRDQVAITFAPFSNIHLFLKENC